MKKTPVIVFFDTETAPMILASFGLYDQNHQYSFVYQDWFFISAQWAVGDGATKSVSLLDDYPRFVKNHADDYYVVKTLHDVLSEADIVVAHNLEAFDWKKFMAKVIEHKLPPIKQPLMVDTLKVARRYGFTSNSLDSLTKKLGLKQKLGHEKDLWPRAAKGDVNAISSIVKYGRGDIPSLRSLYYRLRPYMSDHPNLNAFSKVDCCPNCGSVDFRKRGFYSSKTNIYQRFQCYSPTCGKWFKGRAPVQKVNMR